MLAQPRRWQAGESILQQAGARQHLPTTETSRGSTPAAREEQAAEAMGLGWEQELARHAGCLLVFYFIPRWVKCVLNLLGKGKRQRAAFSHPRGRRHAKPSGSRRHANPCAALFQLEPCSARLRARLRAACGALPAGHCPPLPRGQPHRRCPAAAAEPAGEAFPNAASPGGCCWLGDAGGIWFSSGPWR